MNSMAVKQYFKIPLNGKLREGTKKEDFGVNIQEHSISTYASVKLGKQKGYIPPPKEIQEQPEGMKLMDGSICEPFSIKGKRVNNNKKNDNQEGIGE
jgi:hypothetical protein